MCWRVSIKFAFFQHPCCHYYLIPLKSIQRRLRDHLGRRRFVLFNEDCKKKKYLDMSARSIPYSSARSLPVIYDRRKYREP